MERVHTLGELLTIPQAAELLKVSRSFAYQLAQQGAIPTVRIGRVVRIPAAGLENWVRRNTREPGPTAGDDD